VAILGSDMERGGLPLRSVLDLQGEVFAMMGNHTGGRVGGGYLRARDGRMAELR